MVAEPGRTGEDANRDWIDLQNVIPLIKDLGAVDYLIWLRSKDEGVWQKLKDDMASFTPEETIPEIMKHKGGRCVQYKYETCS